MANIGTYNVTSSSFTCYVYNLDTNYSRNDREIHWYIYPSGSYACIANQISYLGANVSSGGYCVISGLSSSTPYRIEAIIYYDNGTNNVALTSVEVTTLAQSSSTTYTVTISANPVAGGTVLVGANGTNGQSLSVAPDTSVAVIAEANSGYVFKGFSTSPALTWTQVFAPNMVMFNMPRSNVTITANFVSSGIPDKFSWKYPKIGGKSFNLTAEEWTALCAKINEIRAYKGYSQYNFTPVDIGMAFTHDIYNEAVYAIKGVQGYGTYIYEVEARQTISAEDHMNQLVRELNAILNE